MIPLYCLASNSQNYVHIDARKVCLRQANSKDVRDKFCDDFLRERFDFFVCRFFYQSFCLVYFVKKLEKLANVFELSAERRIFMILFSNLLEFTFKKSLITFLYLKIFF